MSWWGRDGVGDVSAEFNRSLVRELLLTQQLRVKVLIVTAALFLVLLSLIDIFEPEVVAHVYQTGRRAILTQAILLAFILFEWWVHSQIALYLKRDRDVPPFRRYVSAFIETSLPSVVLILQIDSMGADKALGFVMPFAYFIFVISSTLRLDLWLSAFTGFVAAAELLAIAMHFRVADGAEPELYFDIARSVTILICGVLAGAVGLQLRRQFAASILAATARDRVTSLFGQHVSPQVVERLMAEGTSGATDIRRVAVMFADFRGFTAAAQSRTPQQVVDRLDGAFAVLVEKLEAHGGIVNKFLGDGFLALFGAPFETPDAAGHAVAAGREMLAAMTDVNVDTDWPLRIGIGIHLGEVVAGSIGSPRRKEYTVIGDTVNFASRLEALNKEFGSQLLISSAVRTALGETECDARSLGEVPVRGYDHPVEVWQLG